MPTRQQPWIAKGGSSEKTAKHKALADAHGVANEVVAVANEALAVAKLDSQAAWHWLQQWSWGKMSSVQVHTEALNNYNDFMRMLHRIPLSEGWMPSAIRRFAQLGTWGAHPGNVNRELKHWLGEPTLPAAMMVTMPMVIPKQTNIATHGNSKANQYA